MIPVAITQPRLLDICSAKTEESSWVVVVMVFLQLWHRWRLRNLIVVNPDSVEVGLIKFAASVYERMLRPKIRKFT